MKARVQSVVEKYRHDYVPAAIVLAGVVIVGEAVGSLLFSTSGPLGIGGVALSIAIGALLLEGSRIAWIVVLMSALSQLAAPLAMDQGIWVTGLGLVLLVCLLLPSSRSFVWEKGQTEKRRSPSSVRFARRYERTVDSSYGLLGRGTAWAASFKARASARFSRRELLWMLAVLILVFLPAVGALDNLRHGSAKGDEVVDLSWHVLWIVWNLVLFALIALLVIAHQNKKKERAREAQSEARR